MKTTTAACLILLSGLLAAAPALAQDKVLSMSLQDCLDRAMEKNLDLRVQRFAPRLAGEVVAQARERFLPTLSFSANTRRLRSPSYSYLTAANEVRESYSAYSGNVLQNLPTGGNLEINLDTYMDDSNTNFQTINPRYGSTLAFQMTQPLLKNFGFKVARHDIIVARNSYDASELTARTAAANAIYNIEDAYWNLVFRREDLDVKRRSLALARDLLDRNRKQLEIGMMAPIETISAESEVATREVEILQAEVALRNAEDTLRTLLDIREPGTVIEPKDRPTTEPRPVSLESAQALALAQRPEILSARLDVQSRDVDLLYARNQLLPQLDLTASYWSPGVSGTQILYKDNDPLSGVIIGTLPGGSSTSLKDALRGKSPNWSVAMTLSLPLNTVVSRAAAASARLSWDRAKVSVERAEQQVLLEVRNAAREVEANYKRILATQAALRLAEKKLEAEEKKVKAGLSMNYTLLQIQRDLAQARSQELQARVDYALALARLDRATGSTTGSGLNI